MVNDVNRVTAVTLGAISLTNAETLTKILSAAIPAALACAYTVWKWRIEAKEKARRHRVLKLPKRPWD